MVWAQAREYKPQSALARVSIRGVPANATLAVGVVLVLSCLVGEISGLDLEFFLKLANGIFVLVYLLAMLSATSYLPVSANGLQACHYLSAQACLSA